ncbi:MAG: hypothetical protein J6V80_03660 [Clostridia bacterium]|nr:hypothetical protein [Clostridia bacterium]
MNENQENALNAVDGVEEVVAEAAANDVAPATEENTPDATNTEAGESVAEAQPARPFVYAPKFTEVSERYRRRGDIRIRERLGIKSVPEKEIVADNPDEIKLDPTAEFDADFLGAQDAKTPENFAVDESDESINVIKFADPDEQLEAEAEKEREEIKKLLASDSSPVAPSEPEEKQDEPEAAEETADEENEEYTLPDPDSEDFGVYEFEAVEPDPAPVENNPAEPADKKKSSKKANDREFSNPIQRDMIKDRFLDSLISIRIRMIASIVFALGILVFEILSAAKVFDFNVFEGTRLYATAGIVDFLLSACVLALCLPEIIVAIKGLVGKKLTTDLLPIPMFLIFGLYTMTVAIVGVSQYALLGFLFAIVTIPTLVSSFYRTNADFIAFKMVSQPDDKQVIDLQNTRDLKVENKALDGVVDEYKSKLSRTYVASFVSDFFKNSETMAVSPAHFGLVYGIPFGVALISGLVAFFIASSFVTGMAVFCLVAMLGCPVFSMISGRISFLHAQKAALLTDSTAIGEDAYEDYSKVDVFAFDDTDIFGPEDVNLKRFMLYGDRENMEKVMRQMCALFAAVGGPLDYMFSGIIDNRVRHKTATNVIIEDDGICGEVAGHKICAGSQEYMTRNGIAIPSATSGRESVGSLDTIKIMYSSEDGEITAKFYIRYSFSEEFTSTIPSLRESGIIPLVYTRDPNVSCELLNTLTAGNGNMQVVKLYNPVSVEEVQNRAEARMITYGDRLDAAGMIVLAKKYNRFSIYLKFIELCAAAIGMLLGIVLSIIGILRFNLVIAALWHIVTCVAARFLSKYAFLRDAKKDDAEN